MNVHKYLENFNIGNMSATLDAMSFFMQKYENFEKEMKFIHIAGTNGKGSCVETINNILICQGYKVGKFISPHLEKFNERISINNKNIEDIELEKLIVELQPIIEEYNSKNEKHVTLFELETIISLLYFYRNNTDFVVLETGLGGLYDCTNIISNPLVSIISSIGYDHIKILGDTLEKIAYQKAGIIKKNSNTVMFEQENEVNKLIKEECKKKNNNLHLISKEKIKNYYYDNEYQYFDYENFKNIKVKLKGPKQIDNASICVETMKILNKSGYDISEHNIRKGLETVVHKGRMEQINDNPLIIFDGAHNEPAIINLKQTIKMYYEQYKRKYIVSILNRKDYEKMIKLLLSDNEEEIFVFTSGNDEKRYASKEKLYEVASKNKKQKQIIFKNDFETEIEKTINEKNKNQVTFIIGSFYVYGDAIRKITKNRINKS